MEQELGELQYRHVEPVLQNERPEAFIESTEPFGTDYALEAIGEAGVSCDDRDHAETVVGIVYDGSGAL